MATTTTTNGRFHEVTALDADWDYADDGFSGMLVSAITIVASAANDVVIIREGALDGAAIIHTGVLTAKGERYVFNPPKWIHPYFDVSEWTKDTLASIVVIFEMV